MADPTCAIGCDDELLILPTFFQDLCAADVVYGEIGKIFLGIPGNAFVTGNLAEWQARKIATDATRLIELIVKGDRPRSTAGAPLELSGGRRVSVNRDFTLNFTIEDVNPTNHTAIRQMQCGGNFQVWYQPLNSKYYFGGLSGVKGFIDIDMGIPAEKTGIMTYQGTVTWNSKFMEEMLLFPLATP